jgi:hypothetical protein
MHSEKTHRKLYCSEKLEDTKRVAKTVNRKRRDNSIGKRKSTKGQTMTYKR